MVDLSGFAGNPPGVVAVDLPASWVVASVDCNGSYRFPDPVGLGRAFDQSWAVLASAGQSHEGNAEWWFAGVG